MGSTTSWHSSCLDCPLSGVHLPRRWAACGSCSQWSVLQRTLFRLWSLHRLLSNLFLSSCNRSLPCLTWWVMIYTRVINFVWRIENNWSPSYRDGNWSLFHHSVADIDANVDDRFLEKPLAEWIELFHRSEKVPYGPINEMKGVFENEQVCWLITAQRSCITALGSLLGPISSASSGNEESASSRISSRRRSVLSIGVLSISSSSSPRPIRQLRKHYQIFDVASCSTATGWTHTRRSSNWTWLHWRAAGKTLAREDHSINISEAW